MGVISSRNTTFTLLMILAMILNISADEKLKKLVDEKKYEKAILYGEKLEPESKTAEVWLMLGEAYENHKENPDALKKAAECYNSALKSNPSHPGALLAHGNLELKAKNYKGALQYFKKSLLLQKSASAAEGLAIAASNLKEWEMARDAAESAIALNSQSMQSRLILAEILYSNNNYSGAAPHFEFILSKKPKDLDYWKKLAVCYEKLNDIEKLAAVDPKIVELDPKDIKSRRRLADYSLKKNDSKTAMNLFKELALLTPNDPKPFLHLYEMSLKEGNKKDGMLYLKNFVLLDSSNIASIITLGDLLNESGDPDGALEMYRKASRLDPQAKGYFKNYSKIALDKKLENEALKVILKAISMKDADLWMYESAGDIYKKQKDYANAIKMYNSAINLDKKNIGLLNKLAQCQAASGDTKNAVVSYQQIVLLNPEATKEYKILGDLTLKSGKESEGIDIYKKYLEKVKDDQDIASKIGLFEYKSKKYESAIKYLSKITDKKLLSANLLFALGDSYYKTNNCKQAITCFEQVRTAKPSAKLMASVLLPLAQCYEKSGDKTKAADAYSAYTRLPGIKDAEASFLKAYLREESDKENAIKIYETNIKEYPKDYRNFLRLGLIYSKDKATLLNSVKYLRTASGITDTVAIIWETLGEVYGKLNNEDGELTAYKELLKLQPLHKTANKRLGAIQIKRKQYEAGVASLEKVLTENPEDLEARLLLANGYSNTNRHKEAADHLFKAKTIRGNDVSIRLNLIQALEKAGNNKKVKEERQALAELDKKIVAADKKNIESRQRLITYSMNEKDVNTARKLLEELAQLTPKDPKVFKSLYEIAMSEGKKDEAIENLRKFIELKPSTAEARKSMGALLYEQKDVDGALVSFRAARKIDPSIKGIYKDYMSILIKKKLDDEIVTVGNAAIKAGEADAEIYAALGNIYKKQGKYADAVKMYKGALETDTKNIGLLSSYAQCQAKSGDTKNAVITYEQVVILNPNAKEEIKELGKLQGKLGNKDQSIKTFKKYLEKNSSDEDIALTVGIHDHNSKQYKNAIKYLELVKNPKLQDLQYLSYLGKSYFETNDFKKAAELFNKVWKSKNVKPSMLKEVLKPLGICYEKVNQPQKAADAYAAYLSLADVKDPDISYKRAFLVEKPDTQQAVKSYNDNIKAYPKDPRNYIRLGTIYSQKKETLKQSASMLNSAAKLDEKNPDVWKVLSEVNGKLGKTDEELAALEKYAELNTKDFSANRRIGEIFCEKKNYSEAITNLEMYLTTKPSDVKVILMLVDAYEKTQRQAKALELLEKAKELKSKDPDVRERLYTMYKKENKQDKALKEISDLASISKDNKHRILLFHELVGASKYDDAAKVADQIRKSDPLNFEGIMAVATTQRLQKKYAESIESYKSALYIKYDYAPAFYGRAEAHLSLKEYDRAENYFKKALEVDPKMALAQFGLAKLYKVQKKDDLYKTHLNKAKELDPDNPYFNDEEPKKKK